MEQRFEMGWCKWCKKMTTFVTHANYEKPRWVCGTPGCFHCVNKLEEKPKEIIPRPLEEIRKHITGEIKIL